MTALVIVSTGAWQSDNSGATMTSEAFSVGLPGEWGSLIVTLAVIFFASSTVLGWAYYGERCAQRLFGTRSIIVYRVVFTLIVFVGATTELATVWTFSGIMNGLMALPNLVGLLICSGLIARETKAYLRRDPDLLNPPPGSTLDGIGEWESSGRG